MNRASFDLPILMYHHIEPDGVPITPYAVHAGRFAACLDAIKRAGFRTLSFRELFAVMKGKASLPTKAVIITFDDGYKSFRELALPELAARGMLATVFIVAGGIGGENHWDAQKAFPRRALMDECEIREILAAGMEIGSHGWAHRNQCECSPTELEEEILKSGKELQMRFGTGRHIFSYPYGAHSQSHFHLLQQAGYSGAVSIFSNQPTVTLNPFSMRRVGIHAGDTAWRFRLKLSPLYLRYVARRDARRFGGQDSIK